MPTELAYKVKSYRFSLDEEKFRYFPLPQEDELLSSWLVRTAYAHDSDPATFINLYFPRYRNNFWNRDIDVWVPEPFLQSLSEKSGLSRISLGGMTLKSYEGYLSEKIQHSTSNNFIQPLVSRGRVKRAPGLRYCPLCLAEDPVPYYRKTWRLSFTTACVKHKSFLCDRCPSCATPLTIYRRFHDAMQPHCYACGHKLSDQIQVESLRILSESYGLKAISKLHDILGSGYIMLGNQPVYSPLFFIGLRQLAKLIYGFRRYAGLMGHESTARLIEWKLSGSSRLKLENIPLRQQYLLFSGIMWMFEEYPSRVLAYATKNSLGKALLVKDLVTIPYWYQLIVEVFDKTIPSVAADEVRSAVKYLADRGVPVCKAEVMRLMGACLDLRKRRDLTGIAMTN